MEKLTNNKTLRILLAASYLHDAYDHKYVSKDKIPET